MMNEISRRINVASKTVEEDLDKVGFASFVTGSTAINHNTTTDVDVVVMTSSLDAATTLLEEAGWTAGLYPWDLWRSFKKTVYGVTINILLCMSEPVFMRAKAALDACIVLRDSGVEVDKGLRISIHAAVMGGAP